MARHVISTNPRCYVWNCRRTARRLAPRVKGSRSVWFRCSVHGGRLQPITEEDYQRDMRDSVAATERLRKAMTR